MHHPHTARSRTAEAVRTDADAFLASLGVPPEGYDDKRAQASRDAFGSNTPRSSRPDGLARRFIRSFANPFSLVLFVLASVSLLTEFVPIDGYSGRVTPSGLIFAMLLLSGTLRFAQELRQALAQSLGICRLPLGGVHGRVMLAKNQYVHRFLALFQSKYTGLPVLSDS